MRPALPSDQLRAASRPTTKRPTAGGEGERYAAGAGMDAYLAKPMAIERLRATLERWLLIKEAETAIRKLRSAGRTERRAFAVLVLLRRR